MRESDKTDALIKELGEAINAMPSPKEQVEKAIRDVNLRWYSDASLHPFTESMAKAAREQEKHRIEHPEEYDFASGKLLEPDERHWYGGMAKMGGRAAKKMTDAQVADRLAHPELYDSAGAPIPCEQKKSDYSVSNLAESYRRAHSRTVYGGQRRPDLKPAPKPIVTVPDGWFDCEKKVALTPGVSYAEAGKVDPMYAAKKYAGVNPLYDYKGVKERYRLEPKVSWREWACQVVGTGKVAVASVLRPMLSFMKVLWLCFVFGTVLALVVGAVCAPVALMLTLMGM